MPEDADAGAWIVEHYNLIVAIIRRHDVPREDALDVAQTVCLRLWQKWDTYVDRGGSRKRWLISMARNAAIDWHRHRLAFAGVFNRLVGQEPMVDVEEVALHRCHLAEVWQQMHAIERDGAWAMAAGYDGKERAAQRGMTVSGIKSQDHRMRVRLRPFALEPA